VINLVQLQSEIQAAGVDTSAGLGMDGDLEVIFTYADALPADFAAGDQPTVDTAIANHVAMREKTDLEYQAEYATANAQRKTVINTIVTGLMPRELVPM
jgi:hypothetical protein